MCSSVESELADRFDRLRRRPNLSAVRACAHKLQHPAEGRVLSSRLACGHVGRVAHVGTGEKVWSYKFCHGSVNTTPVVDGDLV